LKIIFRRDKSYKSLLNKQMRARIVSEVRLETPNGGHLASVRVTMPPEKPYPEVDFHIFFTVELFAIFILPLIAAVLAFGFGKKEICSFSIG
jgi:hypothetical protein